MEEQSLVKKSWRRRWAISTFFIAFFLALWAMEQQGGDPAVKFFQNFIYPPFVFLLIIFGSLWTDRLFLRLHNSQDHEWKWFLWFGLTCVTFWWFGAQVNHYLYYIRMIDTDIKFNFNNYSHLDAAAWQTYASLGLSVLVGILALFAKRFFFPRWTQRQNEIAFVLLLVLVMAIGWVTNDLFRNGIF